MGCSASAAEPVYPTSWRSWPIGLADATSPVVAVDLPSGVESDTGAVPAGFDRRDPYGHLRRLQSLSPARAGAVSEWSGRVGRHRPAARRRDTGPGGLGGGGRRRGLAGARGHGGQVRPRRGRDRHRLRPLSGRRDPLHLRGRVRRSGHGPLSRPCSGEAGAAQRVAERRLRRGAGAVLAARFGVGRPPRRDPTGGGHGCHRDCPSCSTRTHCGTCRTASPNMCS